MGEQTKASGVADELLTIADADIDTPDGYDLPFGKVVLVHKQTKPRYRGRALWLLVESVFHFLLSVLFALLALAVATVVWDGWGFALCLVGSAGAYTVGADALRKARKEAQSHE